MKGIAYFYTDNEQGMAYFENTSRELKYFIGLKKDNVKGILKIKSEIIVYMFIDVYSGIFLFTGAVEYKFWVMITLPHKKLQWRHNQTRAQREAQRYRWTGSRCA